MKFFYAVLLSGLFFSCRTFCQSSLLQPKGIYTSNFTIDEISRNITYYTPSEYGKKESYSLLIFLHDDNSNAKNIIKKYRELIQAEADSANCVVMFPDAAFGHWNSKRESEVKDTINDVGFLSIMLDYFVQQYDCNPDSIYLAGIGNGGDMCFRYNCESNKHFIAIAGINTKTNENTAQDCRTKALVPALNIHEPDIKTGIEKALHLLFAHSHR